MSTDDELRRVNEINTKFREDTAAFRTDILTQHRKQGEDLQEQISENEKYL